MFLAQIKFLVRCMEDKRCLCLFLIGLKKLLFFTNSLAKFVIGQFVIGQFNKPITFKAVV